MPALCGRDTAVEQRHDQLPQLRRQHRFEELDGVVVHDWVPRGQPHVGAVHVAAWVEDGEQPENALGFLLHRLFEPLHDRVGVGLELRPERR